MNPLDFPLDFPVPGVNGWPTSQAVADELRRLDPEGHGQMKSMSYTPGTGEPKSATEIAQQMLEANKMAKMMSLSGIYASEGAARAAVADYADDPDYTVLVALVEDGPRAGEWRGDATHKDWIDL